MASANDIPRQNPIPWRIAVQVSWAGIKRRFGRSLVTMIGVVLAIAFLTYMLTTSALTQALIAANVDELNALLQERGVDIFSGTGTDEMTILLIILTILTCTIGIINSMLMAVTERVREIGTLKCIGARDQFIVKMYFIESSIQGIAGAVLGMVLGFIVAVTVNCVSYGLFTFRFFPIVGALNVLVISFVVGAAMAVVASIVPAYSAARKQPVEALRVEE